MKSKIKKTITILLVLTAFIDWPVSTEAQGGAKAAKKAGEAINEGKGLFKSCIKKCKSTEVKPVPPRFIVVTCKDCCGRGVVLYDDGTQEKCYTCGGKGKVKLIK